MIYLLKHHNAFFVLKHENGAYYWLHKKGVFTDLNMIDPAYKKGKWILDKDTRTLNELRHGLENTHGCVFLIEDLQLPIAEHHPELLI